MGRSPCCQKEGLKKGPWTPEEDEKLIAYVKEHGHGNWRALPKKCGLLRCGKSCRLRWTNYLRPDIKRGLFSHSEEQKIILLHALVGNKWAFIASQLPKRTDNEIKNFWNTVLRKRLMNSKQSLMISSTSTSTDSPLVPMKGGNGSKASSQLGSSNISSKCSMQQGIKGSSHLAQWESARLEAEARLARESQSSKTLKLLSFNLGSFSSTTSTPPSTTSPLSTITAAAATTTTTTTTTSVAPVTATTAATTRARPAFTSFSKTQYPSQHYTCSIAHLLSHASNPCNILNPPPSSTNPSSILSSASMNSLSSQGSTSSALTLRPNGRLSWKTQELAFTSSPSAQKISNTIKLDLDNQQSAHENAGYGSDMELQPQNEGGGDHQFIRSMQEIMQVDLNSMMSLPSGDNWQDLLFDVENSCSDVVSTAWRSQEINEPISTSHINDDATSVLVNSNNNIRSGPIQCSHTHVPHAPSEAHVRPSDHHHHHPLDHHACNMDLDGLTLSHLDSLLCDHSANQHISNVLKEILWDAPTPTRLSISS